MWRFLQNHVRGAIISLVGALIASLVTYGIVNARQGVYNSGAGQQQQVHALYASMEVELSNCLDTSTVAAQVTTQEFNQIKNVLVGALSARYQTPTGQSTDATDVVTGNHALISALHENYPQIDTTAWNNLMALVAGCRTNFTGAQQHLQVAAADFLAWTKQGNPFTHGIHGSFPNNDLSVYDAQARQEVYGMEALKYLTNPILTSQAQQAIGSGTMPNQDLFGSTSPSPAPSATH